MTFNPYSTPLPVKEILQTVGDHLAANPTLIVSAPPGAGKSTLLPLALLDLPWLGNKKIIMLEPRRLAASTIASRMASLLGEPVGKTAGYRVRFENKVSPQTRIEVVTEGILTRMLQHDNALEDVGLVIFDEFHERSIHADVSLALCRETQEVLRPDLRILIMSATLDMTRLSSLLKAPVVESKGKIYPVEVIYTEDCDPQQLPEQCASVINRALREKEGDVLAFLPGQGEITRCADLLKRNAASALVYPLYGQLPGIEQQAAILPDPHGRRKIVLATSIAETSLTIEGVTIVVDSGYGRTARFDPKSGLSVLKTALISVDSADQRAGRAGRLSPGACYRMWSKATQERMAPFRVPEIMEADLAPLVLDLAEMGIYDASRLTWLSPPPANALTRAVEILTQLQTLKNGRITPHGREVQQLPLHPRLGNMLIIAKARQVLHLAADLAALLEERDPLEKTAGIDLNLRIEALRRHRSEQRKDRRMDVIEKIASSYRRLFRTEVNNQATDPYETGLLLAYAYPERIASAKAGQPGQFQLANGKNAATSREDELAEESWLAIAQVDDRKGLGKIFLAAPLNPADLLPMAAPSDNISWNTRKGGLIASRDLRIGSLVIRSVALPAPAEALVTGVISQAIQDEGSALLNFTEELEQWQSRVNALRLWRPDEDWPEVSTQALLLRNKDWLWSWLPQVKKAEDLKKINLTGAVQQLLSYEQQLALEKLAPASIRVPSGSTIKLSYPAHGEDPVLAVRLQEVFGMMETPRVNNGQKAIVMHLLSPGFKPVQVTTDLRSFWKNTYFEVRKELKRRYPKHSWPENPLVAEAVSGARKRQP
ncbi:ATP-dependent helicase HrpB [Hufsiella ginkgonis]|uniref:ATP-dependent helicase HrpB n=1 Tax=Hufsiella ginkgonis TaxID=2695274 RepID=A0A7K1XZ41_9SPHI|nr:ATP-dependent helicase HrpB [Hufsiella ginkgonis]MXV16009.1 ATP-dependent helicase HrpB [Hufsiella ginkgonis]